MNFIQRSSLLQERCHSSSMLKLFLVGSLVLITLRVQQPHISANKGTENKQQAHSAWYVYQQPNKKLSVVGCQMYPDDSYLGIF